MLVGHRPRSCATLNSSLRPQVRMLLFDPLNLDCGTTGTAPGVRQASMFIAPVPCSRTLATAVLKPVDLRATMIGSCAGLRAVFQPCHRLAASVAAAVMDTRPFSSRPAVPERKTLLPPLLSPECR